MAEPTAEFYKSLFDFIGDPVFVKDSDHRLVLVNESQCQALGKTRDELIGLSDFDLFPNHEALIFRACDERVLRTGVEDINEETFTAPNLKTKTVLTRKQRYIDAEGNRFIVGVFKDITAIRDAEEKLQKSNETLEQKVKERTAELDLANEEMKLRIEQLNYLNEKGRLFSQLLEREDVLLEIFHTFVERFPGCPLLLAARIGGVFQNVRHTENLDIRMPDCLKLLEEPQTVQRKKYVFEKPDLEATLFPNFPAQLWIPFWSGGELLGGMQVFIPDRFATRVENEAQLLGTLSAQASIAWDNANHYSALEEKARIESELQVARKIQMHYTPESPAIAGFSLHGVCLPAREIGGDYLDYFQNEMGDWIITIADVCGKGIPAALVMTSLRSCIRAEGRKAVSSKALLTAVNSLMGDELQQQKSFVTCLCLIIFKKGTMMNFSRAGHPALIASKSKGNTPVGLNTQGMALGMAMDDLFSSSLEESTIPLSPGDKFFAYTDGLNEAMNNRNEPYGTERLLQILEQKSSLSPEALIQGVLGDVRNHVQDERQHDDMTVLAFEKL